MGGGNEQGAFCETFARLRFPNFQRRAATQDSQRQNFFFCTISPSHYLAPPTSHPPIMVSSFQHYPNMQTPRSPQPSHYLTLPQRCYPAITIITCNTRTRNTIISPSPSSSTYYLVMEFNRQTRTPTTHSHILQS